jgi:hypothetical protein
VVRAAPTTHRVRGLRGIGLVGRLRWTIFPGELAARYVSVVSQPEAEAVETADE